MYAPLTSNRVKARKRHHCDWCNELIETGEVYQLDSGVFDCEMQRTRMHLECYSAMSSRPRNQVESGFSPGSYERGTCIERE